MRLHMNLKQIVLSFFSFFFVTNSVADFYEIPQFDVSTNKAIIDKLVVGETTYRVELTMNGGVLSVSSAIPYLGAIDLSQFQDNEQRRTSWNISGFQSCVNDSQVACANELANFQTPSSVTAAGHCAVQVRCRSGGDKSAAVGSPVVLWSYELVFNEMACVNSNPAKLRGNVLAVPIHKYWTCPSSNKAKQQSGFPGLTILKSYGLGDSQIRITHQKGYWSNKDNLMQAFDLYLQFKAPDCADFGRPVYMWYGHGDGVIWLDGDKVESETNCGGVLAYVTNKELPSYEATFFVDL